MKLFATPEKLLCFPSLSGESEASKLRHCLQTTQICSLFPAWLVGGSKIRNCLQTRQCCSFLSGGSEASQMKLFANTEKVFFFLPGESEASKLRNWLQIMETWPFSCLGEGGEDGGRRIKNAELSANYEMLFFSFSGESESPPPFSGARRFVGLPGCQAVAVSTCRSVRARSPPPPLECEALCNLEMLFWASVWGVGGSQLRNCLQKNVNLAANQEVLFCFCLEDRRLQKCQAVCKS